MNQTETNDTITKALVSAHAAVNARHKHTRARLLESLPDAAPVHKLVPPSAWRYVVGGVGLGAVATAIVLMLWLFGSPSPAVAMERMAQALDQVTSYSFRMESVYASRKEKGRTVRQVTVGTWRTDPLGLHATIDVVETVGTNTSSPDSPKQLVKLEETHQAGRRGIVVDHLEKEYWWIHEQLNADSIGNPQVLIYMVRQRRGRVLRDLGEKKIESRLARGIVIILDDAKRATELGPVTVADNQPQASNWEWRNVEIEAWIDPRTNLPIEFRCVRRGDDSETTYRFTDLKWNIDLSAETFDAVAPHGYTELVKSP